VPGTLGSRLERFSDIALSDDTYFLLHTLQNVLPAGDGGYSLIPPDVIPITMYFWKMIAISTGGREAITPPVAIIS